VLDNIAQRTFRFAKHRERLPAVFGRMRHP
jgi:hypothetical protein